MLVRERKTVCTGVRSESDLWIGRDCPSMTEAGGQHILLLTVYYQSVCFAVAVSSHVNVLYDEGPTLVQ